MTPITIELLPAYALGVLVVIATVGLARIIADQPKHPAPHTEEAEANGE